jgi:diguanylate cyclase (GGDEF)-like protein/PAS domain S-box-containing protein
MGLLSHIIHAMPTLKGIPAREALLKNAAAPAPIRVLLVEDEPGDAMLARVALRASQGAGFILSWVSTLAEALRNLGKTAYDVMLLDLSLPDSSGLETLQTAKRAAGNTPIIVLTGRGDINFALAAMESGAADYMVKGDFGHDGLIRAIRYALHRQDMEAGLAESESRFRHFFESGLVGMAIATPAKHWETYNECLRAMLGFSDAEMRRLSWAEMTHPDDLAFENALFENIQNVPGQSYALEKRFLRKDGSPLHAQVVVRCQQECGSRSPRFFCVIEDISLRKKAENQLSWSAQEIERLSHFDPLTGLPNRERFIAELSRALAASQQDGQHGAVALLNLKRFRELNEAHGIGAGDAVLRAVADRLASNVHKADTVTHLSADEFAVLLTELGPRPEEAARCALAVAERLLALLELPMQVCGDDYTPDAYFGIALFSGTSGNAAADVLREAETAITRIKRGIGERITFFENSMGETARARFILERELRSAIAAGDLRLYLQPQVDGSGAIAGFEALVRWLCPRRGLIPPNQFIPVAEESDLIVSLDDWVLGEACRLLAAISKNARPLPIAVNLSRRHFARPDFVQGVKRHLLETGVNPGLLVLEVTEGLFLRDPEAAADKMRELTALGLRFSLDDFGTGYSALAYLKRLPIHELKIDQSFIRGLPDDANDKALVEVILAVTNHLDLRVVAEGVETLAQAEFLRARGPITQQGFLHGRPEPARAWLERL